MDEETTMAWLYEQTERHHYRPGDAIPDWRPYVPVEPLTDADIDEICRLADELSHTPDVLDKLISSLQGGPQCLIA
jgi:hypothetical protein